MTSDSLIPNPLPLSDFQEQLTFPLDDFQRDAIESLAEGHSVVVCAPTGSGKTIVAEYAAMRAIAEGKKLFYTTPLKALSNQKFYDLRARFGEANVGLLTGDISVNRDARIVVMTTEIFRNLLYGGREDSTLLTNLGYVVLDECHYMNDADRGTVWEESIIYCPDTVQLVALSATVANAAELADWINEVHHDTRLIWSDFRPVPLRFSYFNRELMLPLFEAPGRLNQKLKGERTGRDRRTSKPMVGRRPKPFIPGELIQLMAEKEMLPAIFFTFSRKDCDQYLESTQSLRLLTKDERDRLNRKVDEYIAQNDFLATNRQLPFIRNGFASHHAGLLPGIKHLVEILFQQGLIKAVFATETLAAGINMPARSTVITKISKRTQDGHRMLTASEFLQMSGRAGRRGMDKVGYVILVSSPYESAQDAATLASSPADPLNSRFTPNYGMVLNLLRRHTLEQAEFLVRKSFAQFTSARRLRPLEDAKTGHEREIIELQNFECPFGVSDKDFHGYERSKVMMHETSRFVRSLQRQIKQYGEFPDVVAQRDHEQGKLNNLRASTQQSPCETCHIIKQHQGVDQRIQKQQRKLKSIKARLRAEQDTYWQHFLNIYKLLQDTHYLDEMDRPSRQGALTVQIRAENEYAMTEVLTTPGLLDDLNPPQLASLMCALMNDSNRENLYVHLAVSPETMQAVGRIEGLFKRVDRLQRKHGVDVALVLNPIASGLVEAWAHGISWDRLIRSTNIGEGDIVRLLRRTADILRQVSRAEGLPDALNAKARDALRAIYRQPIKETEVMEENDLDPAVEDQKKATTAAESTNTRPSPMSKAIPPEMLAQSLPSTPPVSSPHSVPASPSDEESASDTSMSTPTAAAEPSVPPPSQPVSSPQAYAHPEWRPLGTVRDYFAEQIRQDQQRY